jgi:hypothetical protein
MVMKTQEQNTVYGKPYHMITVPNRGQEWGTQVRWCDEQFGQTTSSITHAEGAKKRMSLPDERWYTNGSHFWFRDEADYVWFLLRWS